MGFSRDQLRKLAYVTGVHFKKDLPPNWHRDKKPGKKWVSNFKRRSRISYRKAENISNARLVAWMAIMHLKNSLILTGLRTLNIWDDSDDPDWEQTLSQMSMDSDSDM